MKSRMQSLSAMPVKCLEPVQIWSKAQSLRLPTARKSLPGNCPIVFLHGVGLGLVTLCACKPQTTGCAHVSTNQHGPQVQ